VGVYGSLVRHLDDDATNLDLVDTVERVLRQSGELRRQTNVRDVAAQIAAALAEG